MILTADEIKHLRKLIRYYRHLPKVSMGLCANFPWDQVALLITDYTDCERYYDESNARASKAAQRWMESYDDLLAKISAHPDWLAELIKEEQKKTK